MGEWATMRQAAARLGVSVDTVRRRMKRGELAGRQETTPTGPTWFVELPDDAPASGQDAAKTADASAEVVAALRAHIGTLQGQLEARTREVQELHILLQQQVLALPSPPGTGTRDAGGAADGTPGGSAEGGAGGVRRAPRWRFWRRGS